jgi:hypothetical protein
LEIILLTSLAMICSFNKSWKELGLLCHHFYQVRWWRWRIVLLNRWWGILQVEGYPSTSMTTTMVVVTTALVGFG